MNKPKPKRSRRATILLLVVSLLALLFVIVTGFLSLARVDRGTVIDSNRADLTDAISDKINAWAFSLIREQVLDDQGRILGGRNPQSYSAEDIPGYRRSNYLAALEPVWNPAWGGSAFGWSGSWTVLEQLRWPAVTSLDDGVALPQPFAIWQLMRDYDPTQPLFGASPPGGDQYENVRWNARNPFMDADGDGVPDSHFLLCAPATEAANNMAGTSVPLSRFDPNDPYGTSAFVPFYIPAVPPAGSDPAGTYRGERWQRYDQQARYEVALRIISHGGMVTLDSPTLYDDGGAAYTPFNRDFTIDLFDANRSGFPPGGRWSDTPMSHQYQNLNNQNRLFDALSASVAVVEPSLRHRFVLPGPAAKEGRSSASRSVPVLAELFGELRGWDGFPSTFLPRFEVLVPLGGGRSGQRVNLAVDGALNDQRRGWARAVCQGPTEYNTGGSPVLAVPYARRQFITTVNYSDELARKQNHKEPNPAATLAEDRIGLYRGELKFYLGEVAKAYVDLGGGQYAYDYYRGSVIVHRLARYFYEMLESHDASPGAQGWGSAFASYNSGVDTRQVASRREQAFMLAVNTVAFAAPRDTYAGTRGFIDAVSYVDAEDAVGVGPGVHEYIGYAPQPFFSEAIAYNEQEPNDPNDYVAIAVELYNPNDPLPGFNANDPNSDPFALYLPQFAIALNGVNPNAELPGTNWRPLGLNPQYPGLPAIPNLAERMTGRGFVTFVIRASGSPNNRFDAYVGNQVVSLPIQSPAGSDNRVKLELWRQGRYYGAATPRWFCVDRFDVYYPDSDQRASRWRDLAQATTSTAQPYFGAVYDAGSLPWPARWSMVSAWDDIDTIDDGANPPNPSNEAGPTSGAPDGGALLETLGPTGQGEGDPRQFVNNAVGGNPEGSPRLPITPLVTMNAGPINTGAETSFHQQFNNLPMFGNNADLRPRSFPTTGFMLFVPRYSHVHEVTAWAFPNQSPIARRRAMSQTLEKERYQKGYDSSSQPWTVPADFGHMPIFDNNQEVKNNGTPAEGDSYLNHVGPVPWGLLVFDYFTTLNPLQDANADGQPDVDPLRVPGRININTAPWYVLANLPMLGPDQNFELPIRAGASGSAASARDPSPSFWDPSVAVLSGVVNPGLATEQHRLLATDLSYAHAGGDVPWPMTAADLELGRYRLGPWLAQSAAAYRDGVQYVEDNRVYPFGVYADAQLRDGAGSWYVRAGGLVAAWSYRPDTYGEIRGAATASNPPQPDSPTQFGFLTLGELLNVKGFDSSRHDQLPPMAFDNATTLGVGDFVKAVSLMALLDSQYLTTRSSTFTVYSSVMDRQNPEASVRSQVTVDRSNLLPRLTYAFYDPDPAATTKYYALSNLSDPAIATLPVVPVLLDMDGDLAPETPVRTTNDGAEPRVIANERVGYFNTQYDD